ncbi:MAG: hypothetical protein A2Y57_01785 [Candidatus Woykebacteria bacterium RBG_13_40_7b]|uniref:Uncharacterized protein n=1 Tax=Candidatus Woykebacteria bacterium RBG_13_40_7b TaxID=1802594 RepID=A0A1G1WB17_9BACT|nr:MAG: hypothetical protein A2Y57_01785 [Candidatus Woykebacteria bacterium RBG_13_40_7b]
MTLKQFGFLAAAGVVGFIIFSLPIPAFIKWPFILLLALVGVSFAFIPINDITLDRWILVFLRTIYSPTRRIWKKHLQHLEFLEDYFSSYYLKREEAVVTPPKDREKLEKFLASFTAKPKSPIDEAEENYLKNLDFRAEIGFSPPPPPPEPFFEERKPITEEKTTEKLAGFANFEPIATVPSETEHLFIKQVSYVQPRNLVAPAVPLQTQPSVQPAVVQPKVREVFEIPEFKPPTKEEIEAIAIQPVPKPQQQPPIPIVIPKEEPLVKEGETLVPKIAVAAPTVPYVPPTISPPTEIASEEPFALPPKPEIAPSPAKVEQAPPALVPTPEKLPEIPSAPPTIPSPKVEIPPPIAAPPKIAEIKKPAEPTHLEKELGHAQAEKETLLTQLAESQRTLMKIKEQSETERQERQRVLNDLQKMQGEFDRINQEKALAQEKAAKLNTLIETFQRQSPQIKVGEITPKGEQIIGGEPSPPLTGAIQEAPVTKQADIKIIEAKIAQGRLAPPKASVPNVLYGLVRSVKGLLLPDTILVVKDQQGDPARALKTNKIGQFSISTPLPNGIYTIEVEKEGYQFDLYQVKLDGSIIDPIELQSKN